jgi:hypothetical protein
LAGSLAAAVAGEAAYRSGGAARLYRSPPNGVLVEASASLIAVLVVMLLASAGVAAYRSTKGTA